jgi:hypothetical protein
MSASPDGKHRLCVGRFGWVQEVYGGGDIFGGGVGDDLTGGLLTLGMGESVMGEREFLTKEIVLVGGVL